MRVKENLIMIICVQFLTVSGKPHVRTRYGAFTVYQYSSTLQISLFFCDRSLWVFHKHFEVPEGSFFHCFPALVLVPHRASIQDSLRNSNEYQ